MKHDFVSEAADSEVRRSGGAIGSRVLWHVVWGGMAFIALANSLMPSSILAGRYGVLFSTLLIAAAIAHLALGDSFLSRKEHALAIAVLTLFCAGEIGQHMPPLGVRRIDFSAYYVAGNLAAEHHSEMLYYHATFPDGRVNLAGASRWDELAPRYGVFKPSPFLYPPFFAVLMKLFVRFPYLAAYYLWTGVTLLLTLMGIWLSLSLGGKRVSVELALILIVGIGSYYPFFEELLIGQVGSLMLFCCALGIWLLMRGRDWLSAFFFAFATMIKITPIIVVPVLVFHRKWKWLAAYGCWMAGLLSFSIWQAGWAAHTEFLTKLMPSISCGVITTGNVSLVAFIQALFVGYVPAGASQSSLPALACVVSKAGALAVCAGVMYQFYRYRQREHLALDLVLALLLSLAISPITWSHDYVIAILPFIYLWCMSREHRKGLLLLALFLVAGSDITVFALRLAGNHLVQLAFASIMPFLTIALVYFRSFRRTPRPI